ncbi:hypothetical protein POTOM_001709 [Populus tomentosa]|uniref:Uncharacterized protein n=1 Tax=Populus tomentosa TaxID=118781 RepID=A0A8X8IWH9_POPTO|nr:hypothetical protein POTOM_001709 [Populus tomentosa]
MNINTTADNIVTFNNVVVENSDATISPVANSATTATMSSAKLFSNISMIEVFTGENFKRCYNKAKEIWSNMVTKYIAKDDREEVVYLKNSRTANVLRKGKVFLKLISGKILALNEVLFVYNIIAN